MLSYEEGCPNTIQGSATELCVMIARPAKPLSYSPLTATFLEHYLISHCFYSRAEINGQTLTSWSYSWWYGLKTFLAELY